MRAKNKPEDRKATLPGPGEYSPRSTDRKITGSLIVPGKFQTLEHGPKFEEVPGPGSYESNVTTAQAGPQYGFGSEKRLAEKQQQVSVSNSTS